MTELEGEGAIQHAALMGLVGDLGACILRESYYVLMLYRLGHYVSFKTHCPTFQVSWVRTEGRNILLEMEM